MKVHVRGPILSHSELSPGYFLLVVEAPEVANRALPGQFIHLLCSLLLGGSLFSANGL